MARGSALIGYDRRVSGLSSIGRRVIVAAVVTVAVASCRRSTSSPPPPPPTIAAHPPIERIPGPGCAETTIDPAGRRVCASPFDSGWQRSTHPCPADLPLAGATPLPIRRMHLIEPAFGHECVGVQAVLAAPADLERFFAATPRRCWEVAEAALRGVDLGRDTIAIASERDDAGMVSRFAVGGAVIEVVGPAACRGVEPMPVLVADVRPRDAGRVERRICPTRPCMAP